MRRKYFKPETVTVDFVTCDMLAASSGTLSVKPGKDCSTGVDTRRGEWGGLW